MAWRKRNPACPCCSAACENLCFVVTGCGEPISGATVRVYETGVPGTTLATGTTDANGEVCYDLSAHASKSLSYTSTPPDTTDYAAVTEVLVGNWCGRTVTVVHPPATIPGDPGEVGGTINVLFTRCDGTTPWASATVEVKVLFDVEATGTTGSDGRVTLTVPADGSSAYYVRVYRPTDSTPLNSATFVLSAGECADAHMRITHNDLLPCNPDVEAVITERDCSGATEDIEKACCVTCQPDTIPKLLNVTDTRGCGTWLGPFSGMVPFCQFSCTSAEVAGLAQYEWCFGGDMDPDSQGWGWGCIVRGFGATQPSAPCDIFQTSIGPGAGVFTARYRLRCTAGGLELHYVINHLCSDSGTCRSGTQTGIATPASYTCDPFAATFTIPSYTSGGYTFPARTITYTE